MRQSTTEEKRKEGGGGGKKTKSKRESDISVSPHPFHNSRRIITLRDPLEKERAPAFSLALHQVEKGGAEEEEEEEKKECQSHASRDRSFVLARGSRSLRVIIVTQKTKEATLQNTPPRRLIFLFDGEAKGVVEIIPRNQKITKVSLC